VNNQGFYMWTIGNDDGITAQLLALTHEFAFELIDPTGQQTNDTYPVGWVNHILTSRGFNITNTTTTSTSASQPSSTVPLTTSTTIMPSTPPASSSDLRPGAKAGIAIGAIAGFLIIVACSFVVYRRIYRRKTAQEPPKQAVQDNQYYGTYVAEPKYAEPNHAEPNHAGPNPTEPHYAELDGAQTPRKFELSAHAE
jgi:hypothetical protein